MKMRVIGEWVFDVPDEQDRGVVDDTMYWFTRGAWPRYHLASSGWSWGPVISGSTPNEIAKPPEDELFPEWDAAAELADDARRGK